MITLGQKDKEKEIKSTNRKRPKGANGKPKQKSQQNVETRPGQVHLTTFQSKEAQPAEARARPALAGCARTTWCGRTLAEAVRAQLRGGGLLPSKTGETDVGWSVWRTWKVFLGRFGCFLALRSLPLVYK